MPEREMTEEWLACEWCGEYARDPERQTDYFVAQRIGWTPPHHPLPGDTERTFKVHDWFFDGWSTSPPDFSTGDGMLLVLDWFNTHIEEPEDHVSMGWQPDYQDPPMLVGERFKGGWWASITYDLKTGEAYGCPSLPLAVALAAKAALEAARPTPVDGGQR